jgi:hypothetical protein
MIQPWQFTTQPAARRPSVILFVFASTPLDSQLEVSIAAYGAPSSAALEQCSLRTIDRRRDPQWFDSWRSGSMRNIAHSDLGDDIALLDAAKHVHVIVSEPEAPTDLTYLQAAWAIARSLVAHGASVILDAHAIAFTTASKLQPAGEPLDVAREVRVVYETDPDAHGERAHALHTRGLRKFGAPDLVALCSDADARFVAHAITELADAVARGTDLATPKHALHIAPGVTWVAIEDEHRLGELLQLNNEARVIVDETGHDLVGVLGRLSPTTN